ncbi:hypothetical protein ACJMK2_013709, partial [Sinanodonta woodiana]
MESLYHSKYVLSLEHSQDSGGFGDTSHGTHGHVPCESDDEVANSCTSHGTHGHVPCESDDEAANSGTSHVTHGHVPCESDDEAANSGTSHGTHGDGHNAQNSENTNNLANVTENSALKDLRNMVNNRRVQKRKEKFPFLLLPMNIQIDILKICIRSNPAMQFVLANVGEHFRNVMKSMGMQKQRIYMLPHIQTKNRNPVSVRFLLRNAGRNSGLILAIREIIQGPKSVDAWFRLRMRGIY